MAQLHYDKLGGMRDAYNELRQAGLSDEHIDTVTSFGLRNHSGCKNEDTVLNKFASGAMTIFGVMAALFGTDSPQHHFGHARTSFNTCRTCNEPIAHSAEFCDGCLADQAELLTEEVA